MKHDIEASCARKTDHLTVADAVREFGSHIRTAVHASHGSGAKGNAAAGAVSKLVEAISLGPGKNLPHLASWAEVIAGSVDAPTRLVIHLGDKPLAAEIATRSRISHSVRIDPVLSFSLDKPVQDSPLVLRVKGLALPALPELAQMRDMMKMELGEYDKHSSFAWWCEHKDADFPLACSKFHRIWESLWGMYACKTLPDSKRKDAFWGYLHTVDLEVHAFEFFMDAEGGPQLAAQTRCSSRDADVGLACEEQAGYVLCGGDRRMGEKFAPSAMSFCALLHGKRFTPSACAKVDLVAKLLSAAEWWGPATSGWQRWDATWTCTDRINALGKVTKAQGRLIWHLEHSADIVKLEQTCVARPQDNVTLPAVLARRVPATSHSHKHLTMPVIVAFFLTLLVTMMLRLRLDMY